MAAALLPLEILLAAMQQRWDEGNVNEAARLARIAAPFLHSRRAALRDLSGTEPQHLSDAELARLLQSCDDQRDSWE